MNKTPSSYYTIRFGDCDLFGHLNNARYIDYFINAREDHLKENYEVNLTTYFKQGISWLVRTHEITYLRPVAYNERVCISSNLLQVGLDFILVEMIMMDEQKSHIKSFLWTRFKCFNIKTGKKEQQPENFMEFAKSIESTEVDSDKDYQKRLADVVAGFKAD